MENPGGWVLCEIPSVVGVWIFSGTTQYIIWSEKKQKKKKINKQTNKKKKRSCSNYSALKCSLKLSCMHLTLSRGKQTIRCNVHSYMDIYCKIDCFHMTSLPHWCTNFHYVIACKGATHVFNNLLFYECTLDMRWAIAELAIIISYSTSASGIILFHKK